MYDQFLQSNNLKALESYMDIQVICNAEGAAYYVCSYICKSEPDELKSALGNLINQVFKENPSISASFENRIVCVTSSKVK